MEKIRDKTMYKTMEKREPIRRKKDLESDIVEDLEKNRARKTQKRPPVREGKTTQAELNRRLVGRWRIVKMSEWDDGYVNEEVWAFIEIKKSGDGEFHFGYVHGFVFGEFKKADDGMIFDFTWEGNDECDEASGDGWMKAKDDRTAEGEIRFHMGDKSKFWAKKVRQK